MSLVVCTKGSSARGDGAYFAKLLVRPGSRLTLLKRWAGSVRYNGVHWLPLEPWSGLRYLASHLPTRPEPSGPGPAA